MFSSLLKKTTRTSLNVRHYSSQTFGSRFTPSLNAVDQRRNVHAEMAGEESSVGQHKSPARKRPFNFSAGPACLPDHVMLQAQKEFMDYQGSGIGFMEFSHRDLNGPVQTLLSKTTENIKTLLDVPSNYHVLFFQGGAHAQFSAVPMNLLGNKNKADYLITGYWSQRAKDEASKYCQTHSVFDCNSNNYSTIPDPKTWDYSDDSAYLHFCGNETMHGLEWLTDPDISVDANGKPRVVVADMTSTLLSRPVDISKYGAIYASSGKNLGPAGVCVMIVRDDLLGHMEHPLTPSVLSWQKMASSTPIPSIYNTPPTFLIYMASLMVEDCITQGGLGAIEKKAIKRAQDVYDIVDSSNDFYSNWVQEDFRSRMSIPFRIDGGNAELEKMFTEEALEDGLHQLFGHPMVGGMRVTLYNGVPDDAVLAVTKFMKKFQAKYG